MDFKVLKGYDPDELSRWETENRNKSVISFALIVSAFISIVILMLINPDPSTETVVDKIAVVVPMAWCMSLLACGFAIDMENTKHKEFRNAVCNALAGLELGVYHSAEDLLIHLHISWERATQIIDGQYDDWLRHEKTCRYMPTSDKDNLTKH